MMKKLFLLIAAMVVLVPLANAAIARVGFSTPVITTNGTDTSLVITYSPTVGNCVFIGLTTSTASTISSVVDNASPSNTYVLLAVGSQVVNGTDYSKIYGLCNLAHVGTTITISFTAGPHMAASALEYSGVTAIGQTNGAGSNAGVTTASNSIVTQYANNWNLSVFTIFANVTPTQNQGTLVTNTTGNFGGDAAAWVEGTSASVSTLTESVTTTSATYSAAGIEMSTGTINVFQTTAFYCTGSPTTCGQGGQAPAAGNDAFLVPSIAGDYVIGSVFTGAGSTVNTLNLADNEVNGYTQLTPGGTNHYCTITGNSWSIGQAYGKIATSGFVTMAGITSTAGSLYVVVQEVSGLAPSNPLDKTSTCGSGTSTSPLSPTVSTTSANEFAYVGFAASNTTWTTPTTGFQQLVLAGQTSPAYSAGESAVLTATNASLQGGVTIGTSEGWGGFLSSYIGATQPAAPSGSMIGGASVFGGATIVH